MPLNSPVKFPDFAHRHPVLKKTYALPGLQKRVRLLVAKQPSLHLGICAVVIG
jgi:hypothetical protein